MDKFVMLTQQIIKAQENIIGPLAVEQAKKVKGLTVNIQNNEIVISGDKKEVLGNLVKQYENMFGQASVEVCKDAVKGLLTDIPKEQLPSSLQS